MSKNNGIDLAREIINMTQDYNRVITARNKEIGALEKEVRYYKRKEEEAQKSKDELRHDLVMQIKKLSGTLETVTDIICRNIKLTNGTHYIESIWDWEEEYNKLIDVLDITVGVSETEGEKENED